MRRLKDQQKSTKGNQRIVEKQKKTKQPVKTSRSNLAKMTRTTLDLFEIQPMLVNFDNVFAQNINPLYSPDGPML